MVRLRTFGGISIVTEANQPVAGAITQRRPVALLAILAASQRSGGLTRDKLAGLLWPDADSERARHSLTQTLYSARRALGVDDLFLIEGTVRLNEARISSDVADFEGALDADDVDAAIEVYRGPFLDGFFISGSSEFEPWVSSRRDQLEERLMASIERLAAEAERSGDVTRAIYLRKHQAAIRPLDSAIAAALVALLARTGNRAAGFRHAQQHAALVRDQLGLSPDPQLARLMRQLRDGSQEAVSTAEPDLPRLVPAMSSRAEREMPEESASIRDAAGAPGAQLGMRESRATRSRGRFRSARARILIAAAVAAVALLAAGVWRYVGAPGQGRRVATVATASGRSRALVVVPFEISGASASASYVGAAAAELLAPRLQVDSSAAVADAAVVLGAWRARGFDRRTEVPLDSILRLARDLRADRLVVGSVVGDRAQTTLDATLLDVATGATVARASVDGPAGTLPTLVRQLAARLLVGEAGDTESIALRWGNSIPALQRYAAARLAERRGDWATSMRYYTAALADDSTFATAALRLAVDANRSGDADVETEALLRAWQQRSLLDSRERTLLTSFIGPRYPLPSTLAEQLAAWEEVARVDARSPEAWEQLAAYLFHEGSRLSTESAQAQAAYALDRSLALDHAFLPAVRLASILRDSTTRPRPGARGQEQGREIAARSDSPLVDTSMTDVRALAMTDLWHARPLGQTARVIGLLDSLAATPQERIDALLAEHSLALEQGRVADALAVTRRLQQLRPDSHAYLRLRVLDALYGAGDTTAGASAAHELAQQADTVFLHFPLERRRRAADGCVIGQWRLAHEDTTAVRSIVVYLQRSEVRRRPPPVSGLPGACADLLDAALAVATNRRDALARVEHVDSLMLTPAVAGNLSGYSHLLLAHLYERLGQRRLALAAIKKRDDMIGWPAYLSTTRQEETRLARMVGDSRPAVGRETGLRAK